MWRLKILIQFLLAHLPGGEAINHRLQRLNAIRRGGRAFLQERVKELAVGLAALETVKPLKGCVAIEVGTGWDALSGLMLRRAGIAHIHTFDHVPHLRLDLAKAAASEAGLADADAETLPEFLRHNEISYVAPGDATHTGLPDHSIDLFFSFAVLEHVPPAVAEALITEARRVLKPDGVWYSLIGLHDHYASFDRSISEVNFLRYPDWLWNIFVQNKISYHNRLRERDFIDMLTRQGAEIAHRDARLRSEDIERVKNMRLAARFRDYTPEELAVTRTELIAKFQPR